MGRSSHSWPTSERKIQSVSVITSPAVAWTARTSFLGSCAAACSNSRRVAAVESRLVPVGMVTRTWNELTSSPANRSRPTRGTSRPAQGISSSVTTTKR